MREEVAMKINLPESRVQVNYIALFLEPTDYIYSLNVQHFSDEKEMKAILLVSSEALIGACDKS